MSRPNLTPYELSAQDLERFHQYYSKKNVIDCWPWRGRRSPKGYGSFFMNQPFKRNVRASRVAYFVFFGIQPAENLVCHACDNPPCVNPAHLFLGDQKLNLNDAKNKGRNLHGARHHLAKLTDEKVREIHRLHKEEGIDCVRLAQMFGVVPTTIGDINRGVTWKHLL